MSSRALSTRLAFVPAVLFLVLAFSRPERWLVWGLISLIFFVVAVRRARSAASPG